MTWSRTLGREQRQQAATLHEGGQPSCPTCGGRMWDNRARKSNPKAPDFKCRPPDCTGRIRPGQGRAAPLPDRRVAALDAHAAAPGVGVVSSTSGPTAPRLQVAMNSVAEIAATVASVHGTPAASYFGRTSASTNSVASR